MVEFQGKHLALTYPTVAPGMENFVLRLQREHGAVQTALHGRLLRAFFGLFYNFHLTEMLLGKTPDPKSKSTALQELIEIYLNGILA